jgi:hypothetical protein
MPSLISASTASTEPRLHEFVAIVSR